MKPKKFVWLICIRLVAFLINSESALTLQEKTKYTKFLMGSKIKLTPQEREKYAEAFIESATGLTLIISFLIQNVFKRRFYEM
ncbi:trap-type c4-dicarboxylate transport system, periplasmic component [hydrocarbon metagenome]|uniref:Trap-type c4-dicarboxylate transport system, periplasmic component n=1 Tax=hydrocarbon metagenome TaxID=938273 RepID=A0A0W8FNB2_9ZZZZ